MQFTALSTLTTLALAAFAAAGSAPAPPYRCSTGVIQCCNTVEEVSAPNVVRLFGVLGIAVEDVAGPVGVTCSPITVVGAEGGACSTEVVCCSDNSFNGVVATGCTPVLEA